MPANMKPPQGERSIDAPLLRDLQGSSATGLNGQAAKDEVSAMWRRGLDAGKYFWRSGREKCFSLDIPFYRTSEHFLGLIDSRQSLRLRRFLRFLSTEAPLLHRRYPASSLVRASPPPHVARPDSREVPVDRQGDHRWGFPCCYWSTWHACRRHYPGRSDGTRSLVLSHPRRPSRFHGGLAPALIVSRPAQRSLHVTAYMLAKSPK
jgi:hypothetical protein